MVQIDYALSYNVRNKAIDILTLTSTFESWTDLVKFMSWFNKIIEARGRVMMIDICNKIGQESIDAFNRIGFNSLLRDEDVLKYPKQDGSKFYKLLFPVLKDFTQIGMED